MDRSTISYGAQRVARGLQALGLASALLLGGTARADAQNSGSPSKSEAPQPGDVRQPGQGVGGWFPGMMMGGLFGSMMPDGMQDQMYDKAGDSTYPPMARTMFLRMSGREIPQVKITPVGGGDPYWITLAPGSQLSVPPGTSIDYPDPSKNVQVTSAGSSRPAVTHPILIECQGTVYHLDPGRATTMPGGPKDEDKDDDDSTGDSKAKKDDSLPDDDVTD